MSESDSLRSITALPRESLRGVEPAKIKKALSGSALAWTGRAAQHYQELREHYLKTSRVRDLEDERVPQN